MCRQNMDFLTSAEAAGYLRMKERKLYELVAERALPCTKVTGRWLFPKADLDRWVLSGLQRPDGLVPAEPMPIVGGSHDPLLEWALRESGAGLAVLAEGSERGLARFQAGELTAAAIHLHRLDDREADANVETMRTRGSLHDAVLIGFIRREQGLVTAKGNPMRLRSIADAAARSARIAQRPEGAGAQLLLLALIHHSGVKAETLKQGPLCQTGSDLAQAIFAGRADCGVASRSVAGAAGLDFVPIVWERFDLVVRQREYFRPALQKLFGFMRTPAFAHRANEMTGYDTSGSGAVRYVA
jgi:excisionase family DNA binding protein